MHGFITREEFLGALDEAAKNTDIAVVVLKSAGPVFSPGYDISEENWIISQFPADYPEGVNLHQDRLDIHELLDYWLELWKYPKPIVARVQGPCLSGAGELIAMSDIVIAGKSARFGHPAARDLGIPPTVFLWPLLIGMRKTKELLYTAKLIDADVPSPLHSDPQIESSSRYSTHWEEDQLPDPLDVR